MMGFLFKIEYLEKVKQKPISIQKSSSSYDETYLDS